MNLQPIADFIRYLRFTDGLSSSDIIGWILAALAGIIAYRLIDNMQMSIERHPHRKFAYTSQQCYNMTTSNRDIKQASHSGMKGGSATSGPQSPQSSCYYPKNKIAGAK